MFKLENSETITKAESKERKSLNIWHGSNENKELSNLATRPFTFKDGRKYFSVEHAYQSWKSGKFDQQTYDKYTKGDVKISGNKGTDKNFNMNLMKDAIKDSFKQNPEALDKLLATKDSQLTHTQDTGVWAKEFPKILMEVRNELKTEKEETKDIDMSEGLTPDMFEDASGHTKGESVTDIANKSEEKIKEVKDSICPLNKII